MIKFFAATHHQTAFIGKLRGVWGVLGAGEKAGERSVLGKGAEQRFPTDFVLSLSKLSFTFLSLPLICKYFTFKPP